MKLIAISREDMANTLLATQLYTIFLTFVYYMAFDWNFIYSISFYGMVTTALYVGIGFGYVLRLTWGGSE